MYGLQRRRNAHRPVGVLAVLEDRDERAADRKARAVQRVHELVLALRVLVAGLHAPRLEGPAVRDRADLAVGLLRRHPDLEVVRLRGTEAHVARGEQHHAVREAELLQHRFGVADHLVERRLARVRMDDLHHLDLVELVLANHPARVAAGAAGFAAKARRVRGQPDRQRLRRQHLLADRVGQRDLRRRDQVLLALLLVTAARDPEHVLLELRQLAGALEHLAVDDVRRVALDVAVLRGLQVEHELRERAMQPGDRPAQEGEARARQLRSELEIEAERRADVDMVLRLEVELPHGAPAPDLDIGGLVGTERHAVVGQVGHRHQQPGQLGLDHLEPFGRDLQRIADARHLGHRLGGVLPLRLALADLLRQRVAARLQLLGAGLDRLAFVLERTEPFDVEVGLRRLAALEALDHVRQVLAQQSDVEHGQAPGGTPALEVHGRRNCRQPSRAGPSALIPDERWVRRGFRPGGSGANERQSHSQLRSGFCPCENRYADDADHAAEPTARRCPRRRGPRRVGLARSRRGGAAPPRRARLHSGRAGAAAATRPGRPRTARRADRRNDVRAAPARSAMRRGRGRRPTGAGARAARDDARTQFALSRAGLERGAGRQSELRQDGALQPADRRAPEGRQLRRRHGRAQGRHAAPRQRPDRLGGRPAGRLQPDAGDARRADHARGDRRTAPRRGRARRDRRGRRCDQPAHEPAPGARADAARPAADGRAQHGRRGALAGSRDRRRAALGRARLPGRRDRRGQARRPCRPARAAAEPARRRAAGGGGRRPACRRRARRPICRPRCAASWRWSRRRPRSSSASSTASMRS